EYHVRRRCQGFRRTYWDPINPFSDLCPFCGRLGGRRPTFLSGTFVENSLMKFQPLGVRFWIVRVLIQNLEPIASGGWRDDHDIAVGYLFFASVVKFSADCAVAKRCSFGVERNRCAIGFPG